MDKFFKLCAGIGIIIIAFVIAYRYFIYLPKQNEIKVENELKDNFYKCIDEAENNFNQKQRDLHNSSNEVSYFDLKALVSSNEKNKEACKDRFPIK